MNLKQDLIKSDIIIVIVPNHEIPKKLGEVNKLKNPKVSVMILNKAALEDMEFSRYCHNMITQVRSAKLKGIFLCSGEDLNDQIKEDLKMFADKIVEEE